MTTEFMLLPLMIAGILTALLGLFVPLLATVTGWLVWLCGSWMITAVRFWAALPAASVNLQGLDLTLICAAYVVLLTALLVPKPALVRLTTTNRPSILNSLLFAAAIAIWLLAFALLLR